MKTVIITGSAKGFGLSMLELFYKNNYNVVICDVDEESIKLAKEKLEKFHLKGLILSYKVDVTNEADLCNMISDVLNKTKTIDLWINNAGVNQPSSVLWELDSKVIDRLIDIDLKGTILGSKCIMPIMIKQGFGQIYNVEGHGSNDAKITGLSLYGTAKRGVTYFTEALAHEVKEKNLNIQVGKITPGIMITNFITTSMGNGKKIELDEKTKNIYNILGDYPETIANFMVHKIMHNTKNNVKFTWLTTGRASMRFIKAMFGKKNDYFKENK